MIFDSLSVIIPLVVIVMLLVSMIKILREYERGVIFMLGRFWGVKGPGLIIVIPGLQQMLRVDLRTMVLDVPTQDVISRDNVSVKVNAVLYFRVVDPERAIIQVEDYYEATSQLAQTTLRSVLGQHELDDMLAEREKLSTNIQAILNNQTDGWGIKVTHVEMKQVDLDESMVRAIAKQAEAERERGPKSSMPKENYRLLASSWNLLRPLPNSMRRCNCVICRRSLKSLRTRATPSSSPFRWNGLAPC